MGSGAEVVVAVGLQGGVAAAPAPRLSTQFATRSTVAVAPTSPRRPFRCDDCGFGYTFAVGSLDSIEDESTVS